jgi:hypothetical protein
MKHEALRHSMMRFAGAITVIAALVGLTPLSAAADGRPPAPTPTPSPTRGLNTASDPTIQTDATVPVVAYFVTNVTRTPNWVDTSRELTRCMAGTSGTQCQLTRTYSATRSIDTSLGVSRSFVAAGLNIGSSTSVSTSVSCSKTINAGHAFVAYAIGTRYSYRIQKVVSPRGGITYSGWLTAFNPSPTSTYCVVK